MCQAQLDIIESGEADSFMDDTFDFLYPIPKNQLACRMGLCSNTMTGCFPSYFQCRNTENLISINGMSITDINKARQECQARNTCNIEPVGGEGGLIETPIRDDHLAQNIFERDDYRRSKIRDLQLLRIALIGTAVVLTCLYLSRSGLS